MKYGMNMLLWTSDVTEEHYPILEKLKRWGYDGVELPVFEMDGGTFQKLGKKLDEIGLGRTAVTVCTDAENPISADASIRAAPDASPVAMARSTSLRNSPVSIHFDYGKLLQ